ncbi:MAG: MBOAT family O-acyltransferase [Puia sp.]|nr:MBOAT family O-acyltransferase [Puia sp.]
MSFNSIEFLLFFPVVTIIYFLLPHRFRWCHLLLSSCIFYMSFIPVYILILFFMIGIDYTAGIVIEKASGDRRKIFLVASIVSNAGILMTFKYFDFFIGNFNALSAIFHLPARFPLLRLILPIGLSFHTFQAMSYTIEVYRGKQIAERHLGIFALYVLFFPQLVAGPIERPGHLLRQFRDRHDFNWADLSAGMRLMLLGFFKKLVIADRLAFYVDDVYKNADRVSSGYILIGMIFFSFQIYCDFSGYSDIAVGAARVMGFDLVVNFRRPYFSRNIREFWSRWHISLTSWFRDYVYIPLGGSRTGSARKYLNVGIVFLLSGLWHGAGWNFAVWGAIHALLMMGYLFYQDLRGEDRRREPSRLGHAVGMLATFCLVTVTWVFFRASGIGEAWNILSYAFGRKRGVIYDQLLTRSTILLGFVFFGLLMLFERVVSPKLEELGGRFWPDIVFGLIALTSILLFGVFGNSSFIYFQF